MGSSVTTMNRGVEIRRHASKTRIYSGEVGSILPTPYHNCFSSLSGLGYDMRPQVTTINRGVEIRHYASNTRIHSGEVGPILPNLHHNCFTSSSLPDSRWQKPLKRSDGFRSSESIMLKRDVLSRYHWIRRWH